MKIIKKALIIISVLMCLLLLSGCNIPEDEVKIKYKLKDDGTYEIVQFAGVMPFEYEVPSEYKGKPVTSIGECAAYFIAMESQLNILIIPDSIVRIEHGAFADHLYLSEVRFGSGLQYCDGGAFYNTNIDFIKLSPDNKAFACEASELVDLKTNTLVLGSNRAIVPDYVQHIGDDAFCGRWGLVEANIPDGCLSIGSCAFNNCFALRDVEIPDSVKTIGDWAFAHSGIVNLTIPGSVEEVSEHLVEFCHRLKSVTMEDGVKTIRSWAILDCENLTSINIPGSVTTMEPNAIDVSPWYGLGDVVLDKVTITIDGTSVPESWPENWVCCFEDSREYEVVFKTEE